MFITGSYDDHIICLETIVKQNDIIPSITLEHVIYVQLPKAVCNFAAYTFDSESRNHKIPLVKSVCGMTIDRSARLTFPEHLRSQQFGFFSK